MKHLSGARVTGIIYEDKADEKKLLSGLSIEVKLLNNSKVVGVLYRDAGADESVVNDVQLDGVAYKLTEQDDDRILEASKISAILYGDPTSIDQLRLGDLRIKGLIYEEDGSREPKILAGFSSTVDILPWSRVTAIICRDGGSPNKRMFNSEGISGFLYQDGDHNDVNLVSGVRICGVLCDQEPGL